MGSVSGRPGIAERPYRQMGDQELVAALRRDDPRAFEEFVERYQRVLFLRARREGIPAGDRSAWVLELLDDVAMTLARGDVVLRRPIAAYLAGACRLKLAGARRERAHRTQQVVDASAEAGATGERVVMEGCSEYTLRASRGPEWEEVPLSPALERLAAALDDELTAEERRVLGWVASRIPHREIAGWLGIAHMAAAQRIWRLCRRLRDAAIRISGGFDAADRAELRRLFRRATVAIDGLTRTEDTANDGRS